MVFKYYQCYTMMQRQMAEFIDLAMLEFKQAFTSNKSVDIFDVIKSPSKYDTEFLLKLIKKNKDKRNDNKQTPLMVAIQQNQIDIAEQLIDNKCNLDLEDNDGETALMYAIRNKSPTIALQLINLNCDIMKQDNRGQSALVYAIVHLQKEIAIALIDKSLYNLAHPQKIKKIIPKIKSCIDLQHGNSFTYPPLINVMYCMQENIRGFNYPDIQHDIKFNVQNILIEIAKKLIDAGCNLNLTCAKGIIPLIYAFRWAHILINFIIDKYISNNDFSFLNLEAKYYYQIIEHISKPENEIMKKKIIQIYENHIIKIIHDNDNIVAYCFKNLGDLNIVKLITIYLF
ncbi:MAG: hypothetical protein Edafosvirus27_10 [Edafosvirus sp.]|uniref:Uncharacterized protein n=1 Tax=Edafosvirus sp. TaxID=2487765 RepID=A0A3G4ZXJ8_9VIRU|nr:MAG: hypothetical protein Edafosvirus27_10 [Edafosvirus sp.]